MAGGRKGCEEGGAEEGLGAGGWGGRKGGGGEGRVQVEPKEEIVEEKMETTGCMGLIVPCEGANCGGRGAGA